jgi:Xaa-Pro aminopeptidase
MCAGKTYMTMEPITFVPIETKIMDTSIMTDSEIAWVNAYHDACNAKVKPLLEAAGKERALAWLAKKTKHVSK